MKGRMSFAAVLFFALCLLFAGIAVSVEKEQAKEGQPALETAEKPAAGKTPTVSPTEEAPPEVRYPTDYKEWIHAKTMVIEEGHPLYETFGGIHHVYANRKCLRSFRTGKEFPNGATLVFELREAKRIDNSIQGGPVKFIAVMEKDRRKFKDTGGWGFEAFKGETKERIVKDPKKECFSCHEARKAKDFVFTEYKPMERRR
jgi:hypothetical protein